MVEHKGEHLLMAR